MSTNTADSSLTRPVLATELKHNGLVMLKGHPCKISDYAKSKTGKHGHAKVHFVGYDIFTNEKFEESVPGSHNMDVPLVERADFQLTMIDDDDFLTLRKDDVEKTWIRLPKTELGNSIRESFDDGNDVLCTVLSSMDKEEVVAFKISK